MRHLARDQYTTTLDRMVAPKLVVESGDEVEVETWDAFMGVWDAGATRQIVGPMAGPIAVRGAMPGDALKVELLEICETYALLSLAGDVRISRTFRPISPVKMMLSRQVLDQIDAQHGQ